MWNDLCTMDVPEKWWRKRISRPDRESLGTYVLITCLFLCFFCIIELRTSYLARIRVNFSQHLPPIKFKNGSGHGSSLYKIFVFTTGAEGIEYCHWSAFWPAELNEERAGLHDLHCDGSLEGHAYGCFGRRCSAVVAYKRYESKQMIQKRVGGPRRQRPQK